MDNFVYIFQNPYKKKMCALKYLILQSEPFFTTDCSKFLQRVSFALLSTTFSHTLSKLFL
jgi:hypothetical protein